MKKIKAILIIILFFIAMMIYKAAINSIRAESKEVETEIISLKIENLKHEEVDYVYYTETFYLKMDWDASSNNADLHAQDYFDVILPTQMRFPSNVTERQFDILDENGIVVAIANVFPGENDIGGYVRCTFTDYVENKYDVKGTLYLAAKFNREEIVLNEVNTLSIQVGSSVSDVTIKPGGPKELVNEILNKWGGRVEGDSNRAFWHIRINHTKENLTNVVVSDSLLGTDESFIPDTFVLRRVDFDEYGNVIRYLETIDLSEIITFSDDNKTFTINMNDIQGQQYTLDYQSTYTPKTTLKNKAELNSTEINSIIRISDYTSAESGGSGSGSLANRMKIIKVEQGNNEITIAGAVFTVTGEDGSTFELTTGSDGTITSGVLRQGKYKIKEKTPPTGYELNDTEYELEVTSAGIASITIENIPTTINIPVEKRWIGMPQDSINVYLIADGINTGKSLTLTHRNNFRGTFTDLRKYNETGDEIVYEVAEENLYGYIPEISGDMQNGFILTNTLQTTTITITKNWIGPIPFVEDGGIYMLARNNYRRNNYYLPVDIYGDDQFVYRIFLNEDNNWQYTVIDLPKYSINDGHEIVYTIKEPQLPENYESSVDGFTLTNRNVEKINVNVYKQWLAPEETMVPVTINLYADDVLTGKTLVLSKDNNYEGAFTDLFKYNQETGLEIVYRIDENELENFAYDITGDYKTGFVITNTIKETINITGKKIWDDNNNQDGIRPENVTIRLYADNIQIDSKTISKDDDWSYNFENLDKYNNGTLIIYSISEDKVEHYSTRYDGFNVINEYTPNKTSIDVIKKWNDSNNVDKLRPNQITIHLLEDGIDNGKHLTLNNDNNWRSSFNDLDVYKDGKKIEYSIKENVVDKYVTKIEGDSNLGFTITNSYIPRRIIPKTGVE